MKITKIDTFLVNLGNRSMPLVKVHTNADLYGVGEAYSCGPEKATAEVIADFESWLIGHDPRDVTRLANWMYVSSRFPPGAVVSAAISGIEQALWDIAGKDAGLPVYKLLGGKVRDRVRVYRWAHGDTPEAIAEHAAWLVKTHGLTALKMGPLPPNYAQLSWSDVLQQSIQRVGAVRHAVGEQVDIGVDPHATIFEPMRALEFCDAIAPYRPFFVEEPLRPENFSAMAKLGNKARVPIATGEMLYNKYQFRDLLDLQAVDIVQPDICLTGVWETKKIAALAESTYVNVAPHNPCGPLATAVNVHFAASTSNFLILETLADDESPRRDLVDEPVKLVDGYLEIPEKPGWGLDLNEAGVAKHPFKPWHRRFLRRPDGSQAFQ
jgi:galactonate dehydratase